MSQGYTLFPKINLQGHFLHSLLPQPVKELFFSCLSSSLLSLCCERGCKINKQFQSCKLFEKIFLKNVLLIFPCCSKRECKGITSFHSTKYFCKYIFGVSNNSISKQFPSFGAANIVALFLIIQMDVVNFLKVFCNDLKMRLL